MKAIRVVTLAFPSLLVASPAFAEIIDEMPSTASDHDSGFLLRLALGLGYESLSVSAGDTDVSIGGFGGALDVGIGGIVVPNLAINADIYASSVPSPGVSFNGQDLGNANDATMTLASIGLGVTYYIMPLNLYLAGSLGIGKTTFSADGESEETDWGLSVNAMVGKEFFVSSDWGVGVAAQLIFADVPTNNDADSAHYLAFNIAFTATYN